MRDGDRDAAAARADVEHAVTGTQRAPRRETALDHLRERRARYEHALVDRKPQTGEPRLADEIRERLARLHSLHREIERRERDLALGRRAPIEIVSPTLHVPQQPERLVARVVGAMAEHELVRREKIRERRERRFAVVCAEQPLLELIPRHARASYSPAARRGASIDVVR